jgi:hypothetical protein
VSSLSELLKSDDLSGPARGVDFDEEPVPLGVFVKDRRYLANR